MGPDSNQQAIEEPISKAVFAQLDGSELRFRETLNQTRRCVGTVWKNSRHLHKYRPTSNPVPHK